MIGRDDSPWYPTMTLFRQSMPGDWDGVFRRMARDLKDDLKPGIPVRRVKSTRCPFHRCFKLGRNAPKDVPRPG